MEKPTCGIVKDLLISYHDGLTADSVTDMIQKHLAECSDCSCYYEAMQKRQEEADKEELLRSRSFGDKLRSIRYYMIGIVIGLFIPVALLLICFFVGEIKSYIETVFYLQQMYH